MPIAQTISKIDQDKDLASNAQVWLQCQSLKWSQRLIMTKFLKAMQQVWLQSKLLEESWSLIVMMIIQTISNINCDDDHTSVHLDNAHKNEQVQLQQCLVTMSMNSASCNFINHLLFSTSIDLCSLWTIRSDQITKYLDANCSKSVPNTQTCDFFWLKWGIKVMILDMPFSKACFLRYFLFKIPKSIHFTLSHHGKQQSLTSGNALPNQHQCHGSCQPGCINYQNNILINITKNFVQTALNHRISLHLLTMKSQKRRFFGSKKPFVGTEQGTCATTSRSLLGQQMITLTTLCTVLNSRQNQCKNDSTILWALSGKDRADLEGSDYAN